MNQLRISLEKPIEACSKQELTPLHKLNEQSYRPQKFTNMTAEKDHIRDERPCRLIALREVFIFSREVLRCPEATHYQRPHMPDDI